MVVSVFCNDWVHCKVRYYMKITLNKLWSQMLSWCQSWFFILFYYFFILVLGFLILLFRYPHFYTCVVICAQSLMKLFLNFNFWNFHLSTCLKSYLMGSWIRKMQVLDQNEVYSYVLFGKFYFLLILNDSCNNVSKNL